MTLRYCHFLQITLCSTKKAVLCHFVCLTSRDTLAHRLNEIFCQAFSTMREVFRFNLTGDAALRFLRLLCTHATHSSVIVESKHI